jgi:hypothetical protein
MEVIIMTSKMVNANFTRLITQNIYDAITKFNSISEANSIEVLDWKEKENEVTIKITENNVSEIVTDTREVIYFSVKLVLCMAMLMAQAANMPNIAEIED